MGLVGGLDNTLFLGLVLLLTGCVRAGLNALTLRTKFRVDTDRANDDAHDASGALRSCRCGWQRRWPLSHKDMDEEAFGDHSPCSGSGGERDSERKTFGNSRTTSVAKIHVKEGHHGRLS